LEVGFTNEQSFYRNFRKFTGMTPNAWLKKQRCENHLS
ncbi:MAG: AraC family transcriptional regulator, partial [Bacteroidaceae bacterium]|nr:AraC family transcriptional regulator [Bacteroidaceae bacterium]